ncbi:MAG: hypothetical protein WC542_04200 [Paludibacter sp.]
MENLQIKLNYKNGMTLYVMNEPEMFNNFIELLPKNSVRKVISPNDKVEFIIVFATAKADLEKMVQVFVPLLEGDAIVWISYPKGTSKKYKCDFNRDTSGEILSPYNMLPVRQISIDEDWSTLRFRKVEFIKSITRKF